MEYSGRNFALLEFREMRDLEPIISRNSRNSQSIENTYDIVVKHGQDNKHVFEN